MSDQLFAEGRYLHNTQTQDKNIRGHSGIRTQNPSKWASLNQRLNTKRPLELELQDYVFIF